MTTFYDKYFGFSNFVKREEWIREKEKFSQDIEVLYDSKVERKNVVSLGIENDGSDITEKLQNLFNQATYGDVFYFPAGVYGISKGLTCSNISLIGENTGMFIADPKRKIGSIITLLDTAREDTTMLTVTGHNTYIKDMAFTAESFTVDAFKKYANQGNPYQMYQSVVKRKGIIGIDATSTQHMRLQNVMAYGCSDYGIKCPSNGFCNNLVSRMCGIGFYIGLDSLVNGVYVSRCNVGMKIEGPTISISNAWIDQICTYGIICGVDNKSAGLIMSDFSMDQICYAPFLFKGYVNVNLSGFIGRCGTYYSGTKVTEIPLEEQKKSCVICNLGELRCSIIALTKLGKTWGDDDYISGLCPASYIVNHGKMYGVKLISPQRQDEEIPELVSGDGEIYGSTLDFARIVYQYDLSGQQLLNQTSLIVGEGSPSDRYITSTGRFYYDKKNRRLYIGTSEGSRFEWCEIKLGSWAQPDEQG